MWSLIRGWFSLILLAICKILRDYRQNIARNIAKNIARKIILVISSNGYFRGCFLIVTFLYPRILLLNGPKSRIFFIKTVSIVSLLLLPPSPSLHLLFSF